MKNNNFCRFWGVLTLSFVFIVGAAQTTSERPSSNKPVGSFTVIGDNSNSSGTSVKYKKDELYVQKDDVYYKIELNLEWPSFKKGTERELARNVFNVEADDMDSAIEAYVNQLGQPVKKFSIFKGIKIHYITIKLLVADYVKDRYITTLLSYSDQPAPYMKDRSVTKNTYHTYKWYKNHGVQVGFDNLFTENVTKKKDILKQIKEQFAKQDKDIDLKQIPDQVAVMGTHVIFHSDTNHSEDETNIMADLDMNKYKNCLTEEGQYMLGFVDHLNARNEEDLNNEKVKEKVSNAGPKVFEAVESMPSFPNGIPALMSYMSRNTKYPQDAAEAKITGRVLVQFTIEKDGSISDVTVVNMVCPSLDRESARVTMSMPKWIPAKKKNGEDTKMKYTLPFTFK